MLFKKYSLIGGSLFYFTYYKLSLALKIWCYFNLHTKCCCKIYYIFMNAGNLCSGVDPKSILCEFFKAGQCVKGFKCKFSHDLNVQRKGEKIDIFSDKRDEGG